MIKTFLKQSVANIFDGEIVKLSSLRLEKRDKDYANTISNQYFSSVH